MTALVWFSIPVLVVVGVLGLVKLAHMSVKARAQLQPSLQPGEHELCYNVAFSQDLSLFIQELMHAGVLDSGVLYEARVSLYGGTPAYATGTPKGLQEHFQKKRRVHSSMVYDQVTFKPLAGNFMSVTEEEARILKELRVHD